MPSNQLPWLYYSLVSGAILSSTISLFALFELDGPRWTMSLNILSLVLVLFAVRMRGQRPRQR